MTTALAAMAAYFMTLMLTLTPLNQHAYYEKTEVTQARYEALSTDIAAVVLAENMPNDERVRVGAVLVNIGDAESHWKASEVSCVKGGDHDAAWGPWQTQLPKERVCSSTREAARLALGMVKRSFLVCKDLPARDRLSWYTDGGAWSLSPEHKTRAAKRSQWRMRSLSWVKQHPFTVNVEPFSNFAISP